MMTPREVLMSNTHLEPQKVETCITINKKCKCSSSNIKFLDNAFGKAGNNQCWYGTFYICGSRTDGKGFILGFCSTHTYSLLTKIPRIPPP